MPSESLRGLLHLATANSLITLPVVTVVCKAIKTLAWGCNILFVLAHQRPSLEQWRAFAKEVASIPLVNEEISNLFHNVCEKGGYIQQVLVRSLEPASGVKLPALIQLMDNLLQIPVLLAEERRLECVIQDDAQVYCTCNGFNDGRFMLICDGCESWYHGSCVSVTEEALSNSSSDKYTCPACCEKAGVIYPYVIPPSPPLITALSLAQETVKRKIEELGRIETVEDVKKQRT